MKEDVGVKFQEPACGGGDCPGRVWPLPGRTVGSRGGHELGAGLAV